MTTTTIARGGAWLIDGHRGRTGVEMEASAPGEGIFTRERLNDE